MDNLQLESKITVEGIPTAQNQANLLLSATSRLHNDIFSHCACPCASHRGSFQHRQKDRILRDKPACSGYLCWREHDALLLSAASLASCCPATDVLYSHISPSSCWKHVKSLRAGVQTERKGSALRTGGGFCIGSTFLGTRLQTAGTEIQSSSADVHFAVRHQPRVSVGSTGSPQHQVR